MDVERLVAAVAAEGALFAHAADAGPLDVMVPSCPEWDVRRLVQHLGVVHLWAGAHVADPRPRPDDVDDLTDLAAHWPELAASWPADDDLVDWYRACNAALVDTLRAAAPDVAAWTFLPAPSPLHMWARRQAHETTVHRVDAEGARGTTTPVDAQLASDGIAEFLEGFAARRRRLDVDGERVVRLDATDTGEVWSMRMTPSGIASERGRTPSPDLVVRGTAAALYLLLWNRQDPTGVELEGAAALLDVYREGVTIRWS